MTCADRSVVGVWAFLAFLALVFRAILIRVVVVC